MAQYSLNELTKQSLKFDICIQSEICLDKSRVFLQFEIKIILATKGTAENLLRLI